MSRWWFPSVGAFGLVIAAAFVACGGGAKGPTGPTTTSDAGDAANIFATTPPPSGLPPMAQMPPPGVLGSKKGKKRVEGALVACAGGAKPAAKDPADHVKRVGEGCAAATKMKPFGQPFRGQQGDRDAHQEHRFRVEAKCYRVYFATDEAVKDAVGVLRDSAGDIVAESPGAALPEDGVVCFNAPDEVTLLLSIGNGKGSYAAQVWSN